MSIADKPVRATNDEVELFLAIREYLEEADLNLETGNLALASNMTVAIEGSESPPLRVPMALVEVIREAVEVLSRGGAVAIMPYHTQLTTQEAANYLGVSRPYLISLLDSGDIPYTRLRSHRRIKLSDLEEYRTQRDIVRRKALDDLTREVFEAGVYDLMPDDVRSE